MEKNCTQRVAQMIQSNLDCGFFLRALVGTPYGLVSPKLKSWISPLWTQSTLGPSSCLRPFRQIWPTESPRSTETRSSGGCQSFSGTSSVLSQILRPCSRKSRVSRGWSKWRRPLPEGSHWLGFTSGGRIKWGQRPPSTGSGST